MTYHSYNIGAIEDIGVSPYQITGDPVVALIAQLNRFAGKTVNPGAKCGPRNYLPRGPIPTTSGVNDHVATIANLIMYDRLNCISDTSLLDFRKMAAVNAALTTPVPWVNANIRDITVQIAQFADSLGLAAATAGITTKDPKFTPKLPLMPIAFGIALVGGLYFVTRKK